jgi:hypothetical protein
VSVSAEEKIQFLSDLLLLSESETNGFYHWEPEHLDALFVNCSGASRKSLRLVRFLMTEGRLGFEYTALASMVAPVVELTMPDSLENMYDLSRALRTVHTYMQTRMTDGRSDPTAEGIEHVTVLSRGGFLVRLIMGDDIQDTLSDDDLLWMGKHYREVIPVLPQLAERQSCSIDLVRGMVDGSLALSGGAL